MSNAATRTETRVQTIAGGITAPAGFKASGVYAGIKPPTHAWPLDVMLLTADRPVSAAAVFTTNKTIAAPVIVSREAGVTDLITHGESGWIVGFDTAAGSALNALRGDPALRARLAEGGRLAAAKRTWDDVAKETLEVYRDVARRT